MKGCFLFLVLGVIISCVLSQEYTYGGRGSNTGGVVRNGGFMTGTTCGVLGCVAGYIWASRSNRKKSEQEFARLTSAQDAAYLKKELQWQKEYTKLYEAYAELEQEILERDYEEFKAPDRNNDERITREEVSI